MNKNMHFRFVKLLTLSALLFNLFMPLFATKVEAIDAPSVYLQSDQVISELGTASFSGYFHDIMITPPPGLNWTASMSFGDGTYHNFGKVTESQRLETTHTYGAVSTSRTYEVRLSVVRHQSGNSIEPVGTATVTVTVLNNMPKVNITPDNPSVNEGTSVALTANVTGGNTPMTYSWSGACSGNGQTSNAPSSVGTHTCSVLVTDSDGDTGTDSTVVTVNAVPVTPPVEPPVNPPVIQPDPIVVTPVETPKKEETKPAVLGTQTCNTKSTASGFVYVDTNKNDAKDNSEKGVGNVELKIYNTVNSQLELVAKVTTDSYGYWKASLCPGNYTVRITESTLASNNKLSGDAQKDFTMQANSNNSDINFAIVPQVKPSTLSTINWLWIIIPGLIILAFILAVVGAMKMTREKRREQQEMAIPSTAHATVVSKSNKPKHSSEK